MMPFDGVSTEFYQIKNAGEMAAFARSFGLHLLAPFIGAAPIAVTAHGLRHSGKTPFLRASLESFIGESEATKITASPSASYHRINGNFFRFADLGPVLIKHYYDPNDIAWKISGEGGVVPRSYAGPPGIDLMEHPTLPHMARADALLTTSRQGDENVTGYYQHFIDAMTIALADAPVGGEDQTTPAKKTGLFGLRKAGLIESVRWDIEKTHLIKNTVIPQMQRMITLTQSAEANMSGSPTSHIIGITIVPHSPDMHRAAANFRDFARKYAL